MPTHTIIRRAPLVPVAVLMALGIVAGRYAAGAAGAWGVAGAAGTIAAIAAFRRPHLGPVLLGGIAVAIFCLSGLWAALAYDYVPSNHVVTFSREGSVLATVRGRILNQPQIRRSSNAFWEPPRTAFLLSASAIRDNDGAWLDTQGLVRVTVEEPVYDLPAGREVELVGTLRRPDGPGNPGQFDWRQGDRYRGILVRLSVPGGDGVTALSDSGNALSRWFWRLRHAARCHIENAGERDEVDLLEALVLGDRAESLQQLNRAMIEAGTAHMLSISGQHLGIFLGFFYLLLRLLMLSPRRSAGVVLAVLAGYVLLTEPNAPLLRSAIMAAAVCVAVMSSRAITTANALAAAAVVLLAIDPLQLFRAEFQLSFGIVAGIIVLYRPVRQVLFGRWLRQRGLMVFRGSGRARRWLYFRAAEWGMGVASLALAAYVTSVPLVAYHFGLFSPYAPALSILLSPLMVLVLVPGYLSLALAAPMPNLSAALGQAAATAAGWMRHASMALENLPGVSHDLFAVPIWLVALFYAAVVLWLFCRRSRLVLSAATLATAGLAVAVVWTQQPAPAPDRGQWHILDVGHGSMTLLHTHQGRTVLFDGGTLGSFSAYQQVLRPFLRSTRLPHPSAVFLSHANVDHYNAVPEMLRRYRPRRVYCNDYFGLLETDDPGAANLLEEFQRRGVEIRRIRRGEELRLSRELKVQVLWPPPPQEAGKLDVNNTALVLRVSGDGPAMVLPGDVGEPAEAELSRLPPQQIRAELLLLPHHGSATPTLKGFVAAVAPKVVVQSSSFHPAPAELPEAIAGRPFYSTYRHGCIMLSQGPDGVAVQTMRPDRP